MPQRHPTRQPAPASAVLRTVSALLIASVCAVAHAQEIYLWTDDDGIRHISDRQPGGDYEVKVQRAIAQPEAPVEMTNVGTEREPEWRFSNRMHGPVTVTVLLDEAENVVTEPSLPTRLELPAVGQRSVLIGPLDPLAAWRYSIRMSATPGALNPAPAAGHDYRLPFAPDQAVRIGQGFAGEFSHQAPHSRHAVDFTLPTGTPVLAARAGTVMDVERYFHRAGQNREIDGPRANYVRILHADGSMGVYAHLDYNGVTVQPGQRVEAGQQLGRSGNTGFSTGPHLHFAVQVNREYGTALDPVRNARPRRQADGLRALRPAPRKGWKS